MRNTVARLITLLVCVIPLHATKDRPCGSGNFQLTAAPSKRNFVKGEPVTIRLTFTNLTSRDVYIVPYQFPFDYWVDKHKNGRWHSLATGIVGPITQMQGSGASARQMPTQPSEYRRIHAGESFTTHFEVELSRITKSVSGTFRLDSVRAHVYESDSGAKDVGCALFTANSVPFTVQ